MTKDTNIYRFDLPNNREFGLPSMGNVSFKADLPTKNGETEEVTGKFAPISSLREKGHVDFLINVEPKDNLE